MRGRWLVFLVVLGLCAAPASGIDVKKEQELFQGTWDLVELESGGKKIAEVEKLGCQMTITGDKFKLKQGTQDLNGTLTINPNKKPKHVDTVTTDAQGNTMKSLGIYEFAGDKLKMCFVIEGKDRPSEFKTHEKSNTIIEIFRKKK